MAADPRWGRVSALSKGERLAADPGQGELAADPCDRHLVAELAGMVVDSETARSYWRP
jgi:hypothetical protein